MGTVAIFSILAILAIVPSCHSDQLWIDCHPDTGATESRCKSRDCVWQLKQVPGAPTCTFRDTNMAGYNVEGEGTKGNDKNVFSANLQRRPTASLFGDDFSSAKVTVELVTNDIIRVQIADQTGTARPAAYPQWRENLQEYNVQQNASPATATMEIRTETNPFGLAIVRKATNVVLIDTRAIPGLAFAKQYLQLSTRIPTQYVYGLGETTHQHLKHDFNYRKWGLFGRDYGPGFDDTGLYGVHPFYLCIEDDHGNAHGVFFHNTHALNVALQPDPSNPDGGIVTWRAIGGTIDLFVFSGPTPDHVISQYTSIIGRPQLPPYWALGFQLSRWGYSNMSILDTTFERNHAAKIPLDTQTIDIDYMNKIMDFTVDPVAFSNLTGFTDKLHKLGKKLVLIVDPGIPSRPSVKPYRPLEQGLAMDVFIKDNRSGMPLEGRVWPGDTFYPDFTKPETTTWWTQQIKEFYNNGVKFDGLWIDMNEPSNFVNGSLDGCQNNTYNNPPYNPLIYGCVYQATICLDSDQHQGKHYELHNVYGHTEAVATNKAMKDLFPGKRPFILSRSTFAGSGKYTNHWTGDVTSEWSHVKMSVVTMLEFNLFGIPFVGADICGFNGQATEEMCTRWSQLGAFYPFSRNHNVNVSNEQDPAVWSPSTVGIIRDTLIIRYRYLPYLYSLLHQSHMTGIPVARPLFFDFPGDKLSRNVDDQFMWGSGLMFAPVMEEKATKRSVHFPRGVWYDLITSQSVPQNDQSRSLVIPMPINATGIYLRGGQIVPWQEPGLTTAESRKGNVGLSVGLDERYQANGSLYWDDGESENGRYTTFTFEAWSERERGGVHVKMTQQGYPIDVEMTSITVYGIKQKPNTVTVNGQRVETDWNETAKTINLRSFKAKLNSGHEIVWEFDKIIAG